jgi:CheY-like chemotaxis protein
VALCSCRKPAAQDAERRWAVAPPRILAICYDERLLTQRDSLLGDAGYSVAGAKSYLAALRQISYEQFDLVIIDHNVSKSQASLLADQVKKNTRARVLLVRQGSAPAGIADLAVDEAGDPGNVLRAAASLLSRTATSP